jgi:hypothetical protein
MPDDLDDMLKGEDEKTPSVSPAGNKTHGNEPGEPIEGAGQQTPEEVEFNSLKGSAKERFREMFRRAREAEEKAANAPAYQPNYNPAPQPNVQVKDAVDKLSAVGIATDEKVDKKISESIGGLRYQFELERLATRYNGEDGTPKFEKDEYEDYVSRHPEYRGYLPEDVFHDKMYREEFRDFESQRVQRSNQGTKTLRPTKNMAPSEALTPESIEARLKEPDGREWYEKHLSEINRVVGKMPTAE